jgi:iron(II)-dependent oxidoreductase
VWGSGPARTAAVTQFSAGVSVGGVHQLIGNVWEWTGGDFNDDDSDDEPLELSAPMKSIRGGAFDTYFEHQACCDFRSGENRLARKHNIGFRCALSLCDVAEPATEKEQSDD